VITQAELDHQQLALEKNWEVWFDHPGTQAFLSKVHQRIDEIEEELMLMNSACVEIYLKCLLREKKTLKQIVTLTESGQYALTPRTI
jgi:hypothetical protein